MLYFDKKGVVSHCIHISIWSGWSSERLFKSSCLYSKIACSAVVFLILPTICFVVERHTRLLCSTLERARRTSAPSCLTVRAARPMRTLCLDWDGRCRQPQIQHKCAQMSRHVSELLMFPLRWTWPHTVALWEASRGMAAQVKRLLTMLPPPWKPSSMSLLVCHLILMTAWPKR